MITKETKLELADIAGYLPYGLEVERYCAIDECMEILNVVGCMTNISNTSPVLWLRCTEGRGDFMESIYLCKPILSPMSDMVKPMTHPDINDGEEFIPKIYIYEHCKQYVEKAIFIEDTDSLQYAIDSAKSHAVFVELLNKFQFDYNDLIGQGLAIDINTIKE